MTVDAADLSVDGQPLPTALRIRGLSFAVGGARILTAIDLDVGEGEFVAVIGPNGAGKSTLFNLLSGLLPATEGTVELGQRDVTRLTATQRAAAGLGRTFQTSSVFGGFSVRENAWLAAESALGGAARIWRRAARASDAHERAERALDRVGLCHRGDRPARDLSHGDKRKLEIAILLAGRPTVLLLDEPMAGVSAEDVDDLAALIGSVHREEGKTVVMVEHHMDVVMGLADRVAVLHRGELLTVGSPSSVIANDVVQSVYLGATK